MVTSSGIINNSASSRVYVSYQAMDVPPASTSLIGEGRQHARILREALLHPKDPPASPADVDAQSALSPVSTTTETVTKSPSFVRGEEKGGKLEEAVAAKEVDTPPEPAGEVHRKVVVSRPREPFRCKCEIRALVQNLSHNTHSSAVSACFPFVGDLSFL